MADIISPDKRSALMSRIRNSDTNIELEVRRGLHSLGFRYVLGGAGLPGKPDIVLPMYRVAVFVNGCFWHQHDCHLYRLPKSRIDFWKEKLGQNKSRDNRNNTLLIELGWKPETFWECQLRGLSTEIRAKAIMDLGERIRARGNE